MNSLICFSYIKDINTNLHFNAIELNADNKLLVKPNANLSWNLKRLQRTVCSCIYLNCKYNAPRNNYITEL